MRILTVSGVPWRKDNSVGNTFENFFSDIPGLSISHVAFGAGTPDSMMPERHFRVSEKDILKNLKSSAVPCGAEVFAVEEQNSDRGLSTGKTGRVFDFMRTHRLTVFFWLRELIWKLRRWKSPQLKQFVEESKPDVVFAVFQEFIYLNKAVRHIKKLAGVPLVLFCGDDIYSFRRFSFSPLYYVDRFFQRFSMRKTAREASLIFTCSHRHAVEFEKHFGKSGGALFKCHDFSGDPPEYIPGKPLRFLFTGNIMMGRWQSLREIGLALRELNSGEKTPRALLHIYTTSPMSRKMQQGLHVPGGIVIEGSLTASEVASVQKEADVLVHVESFKISEKGKVRLSFSTKLADYFHSGRCIFATGPRDVSSMDYLISENAAACAHNLRDIGPLVTKLVTDPGEIARWAVRGYDCGRRNHNKAAVQEDLMKKLRGIMV